MAKSEKKTSGEKPTKSSLKVKMLVSIGVLLVAIICILSAIALFNLHNSYAQVIASTENGFDSNIKIATETVVSSLKATHQEYLDGLISEEEALETAKRIVRTTRYSSGPGKVDDGYFWADMADGLCVVHYNAANEGAMRINAQDKEGTYYIQNFIKLGDAGGGFSDFYFGKPGDENGSYQKRGYTLKFEPYGWYISTGNYYEDIDTTIAAVHARERSGSFVLLGTSLLIALLGIFILSRSLGNIVKPIQTVVKQIHLLAQGDTALGASATVTRDDEIGALQRSIKDFSEAMVAQSAVIEHIADGDLSVRYKPRSENDAVGNNLQKMLINNNEAFRDINNASDQVASISSQVAQGAQVLADGSIEQTGNIDQLSGAISTVLHQTRENVDNAQNALENVQEVSKLMNESTKNMTKMKAAMDGISESSTNIAKVIKVIDDIAFQTNILALNAAVEAARAGQHGKGFAVVADEVRNLASKSADAAKETANLISNSAKRVEEGNMIVNLTGESMRAAATYSEQTHAKIEEINDASRRQENAISNINQGIEQIMQVVQANSATSEESAALSQEMSSQAAILAGTVSRFRLSDD